MCSGALPRATLLHFVSLPRIILFVFINYKITMSGRTPYNLRPRTTPGTQNDGDGPSAPARGTERPRGRPPGSRGTTRPTLVPPSRAGPSGQVVHSGPLPAAPRYTASQQAGLVTYTPGNVAPTQTTSVSTSANIGSPSQVDTNVTGNPDLGQLLDQGQDPVSHARAGVT